MDKNSKHCSIERPPSCGSLRGFIPSIPFEHRKFSIESLKSRELILSKQDEASVGSVDIHKNAENYTSKILIKSDRHYRPETAWENPKNIAEDFNFKESQFIQNMRLQDEKNEI